MKKLEKWLSIPIDGLNKAFDILEEKFAKPEDAIWDPSSIKSLETPATEPFDSVAFDKKLDRLQERVDSFMNWKPAIKLPRLITAPLSFIGLNITHIHLPSIVVFAVPLFWGSVIFTIYTLQ